MTHKRVMASEKKQRHEWAIRQIDAGMGLSELTAFTAETWGCSRRNACDVVCAAHKDWLDAATDLRRSTRRTCFSSVDAERIAARRKISQFSAAVGAITVESNDGVGC